MSPEAACASSCTKQHLHGHTLPNTLARASHQGQNQNLLQHINSGNICTFHVPCRITLRLDYQLAYRLVCLQWQLWAGGWTEYLRTVTTIQHQRVQRLQTNSWGPH